MLGITNSLLQPIGYARVGRDEDLCQIVLDVDGSLHAVNPAGCNWVSSGATTKPYVGPVYGDINKVPPKSPAPQPLPVQPMPELGPEDEGTLAAFAVKETAGCTCDTCQEIRRQRGIQPLHTLASLLSADAIYCDAPSIIFDVHTQYQDIPVEYRQIVEAQGGLGCTGTGQVSTHCRSCHWVRTA